MKLFFKVLCGLGLVVYGVLLIGKTSLSVGWTDSSGYFGAAQLFASGKLYEEIVPLQRFGLPDSDQRVFLPLGFTVGPRPGTMTPAYLPGLPLHMAAAALIGGWTTAPFLVMPMLALACMPMMYLLGREFGLSPSLAAVGAAILGCCPTFVCYATQPMSDLPATAWAMATVLAALGSRRRASLAYFSGAAFAIGVLVRPSNLLLLAPLAFALPAKPGTWVRWILGGLPIGVLLLGYNSLAFGNPFSTGYGDILANAMALANFPARFKHYSYWLVLVVGPVVPLGWIAVAANGRVARRDRSLLLTWFAVFLVFYCCYAIYDKWWYTRFLLPGIPAMILGALLVARDVVGRIARQGATSRRAWVKWTVSFLLLTNALAFSLYYDRRLKVLEAYRDDRVFPDACRWAKSLLPEESVVVSMQMAGALRTYTGLTFARWDWIEADRFQVLRARIEDRGYRWYALLMPFEIEPLRRNLPGRWTEVGTLRQVTLFRLEGPYAETKGVHR